MKRVPLLPFSSVIPRFLASYMSLHAIVSERTDIGQSHFDHPHLTNFGQFIF